jgi:hypothetical protein
MQVSEIRSFKRLKSFASYEEFVLIAGFDCRLKILNHVCLQKTSKYQLGIPRTFLIQSMRVRLCGSYLFNLFAIYWKTLYVAQIIFRRMLGY